MAPRLNIPPLTRALLLGFVFFTSLNAYARYRLWTSSPTPKPFGDRGFHAPYLTIVPGSSLVYPWVFVTATLAEQNVAGLVTTGATLFYGGRYLERAWSSSEYTKFMLLVSLVPNVASFVAYFLLYVLSRNPAHAATSINGGIAIQAGFLVAFKQLVPEHTVSVAKGIIRIRVKHFPAIFLVANTISGVALGTDTAMLLAWIGFLTSWTYLRFYRVSPSLSATATGEGSSIRGDASDTFAFAYFFPDAIHAPVAALSDAAHSVMVALRICSPFSAEDVESSNEQVSARGQAGLPSASAGRGGKGAGRREEAERRRALALRALDQRLTSAATRPATVLATPEAAQQAQSNIATEPERVDSESRHD